MGAGDGSGGGRLGGGGRGRAAGVVQLRVGTGRRCLAGPYMPEQPFCTLFPSGLASCDAKQLCAVATRRERIVDMGWTEGELLVVVYQGGTVDMCVHAGRR
jgi:hypothetical protein